MNITPKNVKRTLKKTVKEISDNPQIFAKNPEKDLKCELLDFFDLSKDLPTVSAFVQQRNKISANAFETLFHQFTSSFSQQKLYTGYRLLAVDGSVLHTPTNPQEESCYYPGANGQRPYNLMHLNKKFFQKNYYKKLFMLSPFIIALTT